MFESHAAGQSFDDANWLPFDPNETNITFSFNGATVTKLPYAIP